MKVLILGESCLDVFHYGKCTRLAPAAPVPVFNSCNIVSNGGMAMNVYNNLKKFIDDVDILTNDNWKDIKKTRFVEDRTNHMFLRLDENDTNYSKINIENIEFSKYDAVIVSDYNKGFLSIDDMKKISELHHNTFLDTKKTLGSWCKKFTYIKINGVEYENTKHLLDDEIIRRLIVTQGPQGCFFMGKEYNVPLVEIKDVSGAGDTFLASFCYKILSTNNIDESINFANQCATIVVQKKGVSTL